MDPPKVFLPDTTLGDSNLVCAFARAQKIIDCEDLPYETRGQARAFLMEIYGKLESIANTMDSKTDAAYWHPKHLQTVVHLLQGTLSLNMREFPNAENELKVSHTVIILIAESYCLDCPHKLG